MVWFWLFLFALAVFTCWCILQDRALDAEIAAARTEWLDALEQLEKTIAMPKKDQLRIGEEVSPNTRLVERRGERSGVGTLTPVRDGQALPEGAELVKITPGQDGWHDVETIYKHEPVTELNGPPQVATPAYRDGWSRIFGKKPTVGVA